MIDKCYISAGIWTATEDYNFYNVLLLKTLVNCRYKIIEISLINYFFASKFLSDWTVYDKLKQQKVRLKIKKEPQNVNFKNPIDLYFFSN